MNIAANAMSVPTIISDTPVILSNPNHKYASPQRFQKTIKLRTIKLFAVPIGINSLGTFTIQRSTTEAIRGSFAVRYAEPPRRVTIANHSSKM